MKNLLCAVYMRHITGWPATPVLHFSNNSLVFLITNDLRLILAWLSIKQGCTTVPPFVFIWDSVVLLLWTNLPNNSSLRADYHNGTVALLYQMCSLSAFSLLHYVPVRLRISVQLKQAFVLGLFGMHFPCKPFLLRRLNTYSVMLTT